MRIKITGDSMSNDLSPHSAGLWPMPEAGESPAMWRVSWLPDRPVGRNEATSAMVLAETVAATPDLGPDHRMWGFIDSWAAELGLSGDDYIDRMAEHIQEHGPGSLGDVELNRYGLNDDGHHRTYASYLASEWTVPVRQANREAGE